MHFTQYPTFTGCNQMVDDRPTAFYCIVTRSSLNGKLDLLVQHITVSFDSNTDRRYAHCTRVRLHRMHAQGLDCTGGMYKRSIAHKNYTGVRMYRRNILVFECTEGMYKRLNVQKECTSVRMYRRYAL